MQDQSAMEPEASIDLERAVAADRGARESRARAALELALQEIQRQHRVDLVVVLRVLPSGATVPGIEFRAR